MKSSILAMAVAVVSSLAFIPDASAATGMASWYGPGFHGRRTASGERFNQNAMTAAHRTLPFGERVRVTNKRTGRSVVVRINDRGPFHGGRIIDLSKGSARALGMGGTALVSISRVGGRQRYADADIE